MLAEAACRGPVQPVAAQRAMQGAQVKKARHRVGPLLDAKLRALQGRRGRADAELRASQQAPLERHAQSAAQLPAELKLRERLDEQQLEPLDVQALRR